MTARREGTEDLRRFMNILDAIGNTSLVRLGKIVPPDCAEIFVKLEWENPTGNMKDRMARATIASASSPPKPSVRTRAITWRRLVAELTIVPSDGGRSTRELFPTRRLAPGERARAEARLLSSTLL